MIYVVAKQTNRRGGKSSLNRWYDWVNADSNGGEDSKTEWRKLTVHADGLIV